MVLANLTTALAWSCYFFGLSHLDPSVVNTIHSAMGPLTVVVLGWFGIRLAQMPKVGWIENLSYAGIAASIVGLWWVVLSGRSGLEIGNTRDTVLGLALLAVSGMSITVSLLYCKRLQDAGIGAATVTAVRYLAIIVLAAGVAFWKGGLGGIDTIGQGVTLSVGVDPADRAAALCAAGRHRPRRAAAVADHPRARAHFCIRARAVRRPHALLDAGAGLHPDLFGVGAGQQFCARLAGREGYPAARTSSASSRLKRGASSQNVEWPTPS